MCETEGGLHGTSAVLIHCHGNANLIVSDLYVRKGDFVTVFGKERSFEI